MIRLVPPFLAALLLAGCVAEGAVSDGPGIAPIPGSITYGGQPRSKLRKAPVGSTFDHVFHDNLGRRVVETYRIQPDRSLLLIHRRVRIEYF